MYERLNLHMLHMSNPIVQLLRLFRTTFTSSIYAGMDPREQMEGVQPLHFFMGGTNMHFFNFFFRFGGYQGSPRSPLPPSQYICPFGVHITTKSEFPSRSMSGNSIIISPGLGINIVCVLFLLLSCLFLAQTVVA